MTTTAAASTTPETARYRVTGMDCPSCAVKIEKAARAVPGVAEVKVSVCGADIAVSHLADMQGQAMEHWWGARGPAQGVLCVGPSTELLCRHQSLPAGRRAVLSDRDRKDR
jgi:cation transport ATPase